MTAARSLDCLPGLALPRTLAGPGATAALLSDLGHDAKEIAAHKARAILNHGFHRSICR